MSDLELMQGAEDANAPKAEAVQHTTPAENDFGSTPPSQEWDDEAPILPRQDIIIPTENDFGNMPEGEPEVEYVEPPVKSKLVDVVDTRKQVKITGIAARLAPLGLLYGTLESSVAALSRQEDAAIDRPGGYAVWTETIEDSYENYYRTASGRSPFEEPALREGSVWAQNLDVNGVKYAGRSQRLPVESGERLVGADALARVTRAIGMGAIIQVPCWHSGIWASIKAPGDVELYELERRIAMEKVRLGRMSKGLVFSNTSVYIAGHLINFILQHLYSSTAPTDDPGTLKKIIRVQDIPTLIWGMVTAIYPGGYPYRQPCLSNVSKCTHIVEALLDLGKLQWVDRSMLTEKQKAMMTQRNQRTTQASIDEYQAEFGLRNDARAAVLNDQLTIEFESPSMETYENSGYSWIEAIVNTTDAQFGSTLTGKERSDYISDIARTTAPRQYSHWVKAIEVTDEKGINTRIEDRASIEASMVQIASVDDVKRAFIKAVGAYIDATTVSIIGYVNYACPKCGELQLKGDGEKTRIIPLDMMQVFLTLQRHKIDQVLKDVNAI